MNDGLKISRHFQNVISFYKDRKIFLTGHTGFKGAWLSLWLGEMGAKVCGFALKPEEESLFNLAKVEESLEESVIGDIRNRDEINLAVKKFQPEIIIHMAAQPLVRDSYVDPLKTYETNVIGTLNVFEAARKSGSVKTILNVTTDKCYENRESLRPYQENDRLGGYDPYSSSKACAEILTSSYRRSFFEKEEIGIASARAGNVIGGGDFSVDRIIPDIVRAIRDGKKVEIRSPKSIRPWQHVLEPLYGYLLLTKNLFERENFFSKAYNFGPDSDAEVTVEELVKAFIQRIGCGSYEVGESKDFHEANLLRLDSTMAKTELGWSPKLSFRESISWTVDWYKCYLNDKKQVKDLSKAQISIFNGFAKC